MPILSAASLNRRTTPKVKTKGFEYPSGETGVENTVQIDLQLKTYMFVMGDYSDYWQYTMIMVVHVLICCLASWLKSFAAPCKLRRSWAPFARTGEGIGGCWQCHLPMSLLPGVLTTHQDALFLRKGQGPFRVLSDFKTAAEWPWHPLKDVNPGNGNAPGAA